MVSDMSKLKTLTKPVTYPRIGGALAVDVFNQSTGEYKKVYFPHIWTSENSGAYAQEWHETKAEADMAAAKLLQKHIEDKK